LRFRVRRRRPRHPDRCAHQRLRQAGRQSPELLIRVPLAAMIESEFRPGPGYIDISRADEALRNAAKLT